MQQELKRHARKQFAGMAMPHRRSSGTCRQRPPAYRMAMPILLGLLLSLTACTGAGDDKAKHKNDESGSNTLSQPTATLGAHALVFQRIHGGLDTIRTPPLSTAQSGSIMLASIGRGQIAAFEPPTDNFNAAPFQQIDTTHAYTNWSNSGTALYALENARGGSGHVFQTTTPPEDEVTLAVVEVFGSHVEDAAWNEVLYSGSFQRIRRSLFSQNQVTSASVETSGPATLVAFWWGDADVAGDKTAEPNNGFTVIDAVLEPGALVQCAVAVRHVNAAGRFEVTWTSSPLQGAQMWLVAVADQQRGHAAEPDTQSNLSTHLPDSPALLRSSEKS